MQKKGKTQIFIDRNFSKRYLSAFRSAGRSLFDAAPDIIVALSRKGPRLLELMNLWGIWKSNIPIITEKAIDFIPSEQLKGKKIVVFDDIIISGTSLTDLITILSNKYDIDITILCVAIDEDTIALKKNESGIYYVCGSSGRTYFLDYKIPIKKEDRFIFCNGIVRSFVALNKPYDIDYPIVYTSFDPEIMYSLIEKSEPDRLYDVTTEFQSLNGFNRYTIMPTNMFVINLVIKDILNEIKLNPQICKIRCYLDRNNELVTFAPIVTFCVNKRNLSEDHIFSIDFDILNDLINKIKNYIDLRNLEPAMYRLLWYLVNYLYCLLFFELNFNNHKQTKTNVIKKFLRTDLCYLFGPNVTNIIIDFIGKYAERLEKQIGELFKYHTLNNNGIEEMILVPESHFDERRKIIYEEIKEYLGDHIKPKYPLSNQLATIFEGLYYNVEYPAQIAYKRDGIRGDEHKRLKIGFNHDQIKEILLECCPKINITKDFELALSLATDFLVDAGIEIPLFYYERKDQYYERIYRYGEEALSAKKCAYLFASSFKELFSYVKNNYEKEHVPRITLEKIGIICQEEMARTGIIDILKELEKNDDREIVFAPSYCRHGKILKILDQADEDEMPRLFTEWCKKEGIIEYSPSVHIGATYSNKYFDNIKFVDGSLPKLISETELAPYISIGILLYIIDQKIDKSDHSEYLIAMTACADQESYLRAIREELRLFFKGKEYKFALAFGLIKKYIDLQKEDETLLKRALELINQKSSSCAHAVRCQGSSKIDPFG